MKYQLLFLTIYLITITYWEEEDTCVNKPKSECTSSNGCTWTKITDASCINQCSTLSTESCSSPCTIETTPLNSCDINPFFQISCSTLDSSNCEGDTSKVVCELNQSSGSCQSIDCSTKSNENCSGICSWDSKQIMEMVLV